jgi:hypothetical protein
MAQGTVSIPVLAVCIVLTALVTTAIFTCIACLHVRRSNRELAYREEQRYFHPVPTLDTPHVIDLPASYAGTPTGGRSPRIVAEPGRSSTVGLSALPSRSIDQNDFGVALKQLDSPRPSTGLVLFPPERSTRSGNRGEPSADNSNYC